VHDDEIPIAEARVHAAQRGDPDYEIGWDTAVDDRNR